MYKANNFQYQQFITLSYSQLFRNYEEKRSAQIILLYCTKL